MTCLEQNMKTLTAKPTSKPDEEYITLCHQALLNLYPGIQLRWSKIYGLRWAHLLGNSQDVSYCSLKIQLNQSYGVNIDNTDVMPAEEIEEIVSTLKRCFTDEF